MMLLYVIVFYLFVGPHNLASACFGRKKIDESKIKNFENGLWKFETAFVQHAGKPDKSRAVYSPHSAAISLLAIAFGGEIKCKLGEALHLNMSDLRLPMSGSAQFATDLREFVRLGHVGSASAPILHTKYTNHVSKKCKVKSHYKDILQQLRVGALAPKGDLSSKQTVQSVVADELKVKISDFAEKCRVRKSSSRLEFHAENVRAGTIKSLGGVQYYSIPATGTEYSAADKVRLVFILPSKGLKIRDLKQKFSKLKYQDLSEGNKKSLTFSIRKPKKISKQYDLKSYLAHAKVNMSRHSADTIPDKFDDICDLSDDFKMHGFHIKQSGSVEFDDKDLKKAPRCGSAQRRVNVKLPKSSMILILAKKTILLVATT